MGQNAVRFFAIGMVYDATGTYQLAWIGLLVSFVIAAAVVMVTRPPAPR